MASLPVLTTDRLTLRPLAREDGAALHAAFSDPEVMKYWSGGPHETLEQTLDYAAENAVRYSFATVGTALWVSSFILIAGFLVLTQSPFLINAMMGLVVALTIFVALILDFLMLPPLLIAFDGRGEDPTQDSYQKPQAAE